MFGLACLKHKWWADTHIDTQMNIATYRINRPITRGGLIANTKIEIKLVISELDITDRKMSHVLRTRLCKMDWFG